jgi:hypothetical protein
MYSHILSNTTAIVLQRLQWQAIKHATKYETFFCGGYVDDIFITKERNRIMFNTVSEF